MMTDRFYYIDGNNFTTLEGFYDEVSKVLIPNVSWGENLDALNDILYGGFGTLEERFTLVWKNSETSKARLGYSETVRQLHKRLKEAHPNNKTLILEEIKSAKANEGQTVFDWLVDIVRSHKNVHFVLS